MRLLAPGEHPNPETLAVLASALAFPAVGTSGFTRWSLIAVVVVTPLAAAGYAALAGADRIRVLAYAGAGLFVVPVALLSSLLLWLLIIYTP